MSKALDRLTQAGRPGNDVADSAALVHVDFLMREYGFTRDEMSEPALEFGRALRALVAEWITGEQ